MFFGEEQNNVTIITMLYEIRKAQKSEKYIENHIIFINENPLFKTDRRIK